MTVSKKTWAKVRASYCDSDELVADICARFKVDPRALYKRAKAEGWQKRSTKPGYVNPLTRLGIAVKGGKGAVEAKRNTKAARTALALRLYKALDLKLTQLEQLMAGRKETSSMDQGRQTRAIAQLIKAFERVTEYDPELLKSASLAGLTPGDAFAVQPAADAAAGSPADDASKNAVPADGAATEQLRRDIAGRIERIVAQRNTGEGAG